MSRGVNKAILIGNLGQDPDTRYTPSGNPVVNLNLATDESYKDKSTGQKVPKTEWHRVVVFGKLAEIVSQYCRKGSKLYVEGKMQTRKWQGQDGQDRYTTEVVVDINGQIQMLDSKPQGDGQQGNQKGASQGQQRAGQNQYHQYSQSGSGNHGSHQGGGSLPEPADDFDDDK